MESIHLASCPLFDTYLALPGLFPSLWAKIGDSPAPNVLLDTPSHEPYCRDDEATGPPLANELDHHSRIRPPMIHNQWQRLSHQSAGFVGMPLVTRQSPRHALGQRSAYLVWCASHCIILPVKMLHVCNTVPTKHRFHPQSHSNPIPIPKQHNTQRVTGNPKTQSQIENPKRQPKLPLLIPITVPSQIPKQHSTSDRKSQNSVPNTKSKARTQTETKQKPKASSILHSSSDVVSLNLIPLVYFHS